MHLHAGRRGIARVGGLAGIVATAATLAACATSGYTYASSGDGTAFFKVPASWHAFGQQDLLRASNLDASPGPGSEFTWAVGYDASPHPSTRHILAPATNYPVVEAFERQLSPGDRDTMSLLTMRNSLFQVDQLANQGLAKIISDDENLTFPGGFHGNRVDYVVALRGLSLSAGNQTVRLTQIAVVDSAVQHFYFFFVGCTSDCYTQYQGTINQVLGSWTVKER